MAGTNNNDLIHADDTTGMQQVKITKKPLHESESEKASLNLTFNKLTLCHPVPSLHGKLMKKQWKQ